MWTFSPRGKYYSEAGCSFEVVATVRAYLIVWWVRCAQERFQCASSILVSRSTSVLPSSQSYIFVLGIAVCLTKFVIAAKTDAYIEAVNADLARAHMKKMAQEKGGTRIPS